MSKKDRAKVWGDAEEQFKNTKFTPAPPGGLIFADEDDEQIVGIADGRDYKDPALDPLFNERAEGIFFARCARDEHGHCLPESGEIVSTKELKAAQALAITKANLNPTPTKEQVKDAHQRMDKLGADDYEMQIRGSSSDRRKSRQKLLHEFGDGKTCPCVYCGRRLDDSTLTRDKIYTAREGGRYRHDNLVPACLACNKSRGDISWKDIHWDKQRKELNHARKPYWQGR
jgi:hypothetical protein